MNNENVLIKLGGNTLHKYTLPLIINWIYQLYMTGNKIVVVHGGGVKVSEMLRRLDIEPKFHQGIRITDQETLDITEMVLCGHVGKSLAYSFSNHHMKAISISGKDVNLFTCHKKISDFDYGWVGDVSQVNLEVLDDLLRQGIIPLVAPIGCDKDGQTYNINADDLADGFLNTNYFHRAIFVTDVEGVRQDVKDETSVIHELEVEEVEKMIESGIIQDGMIPKIRGLVNAAKHTKNGAQILGVKGIKALVSELSTLDKLGTTIKGEFK